MTKKEFVDLFQKNTGMKTKAEAEKAVEGFMATVQEVMALGDDVTFTGWGKFETVEREARTGRNPSTGAEIQIPAKRVVKFRIGKKFAEAVER
ncbi:MAG: HU family DNA-binding protein [Fusobacteriaceae bacterium]